MNLDLDSNPLDVQLFDRFGLDNFFELFVTFLVL